MFGAEGQPFGTHGSCIDQETPVLRFGPTEETDDAHELRLGQQLVVEFLRGAGHKHKLIDVHEVFGEKRSVAPPPRECLETESGKFLPASQLIHPHDHLEWKVGHIKIDRLVRQALERELFRCPHGFGNRGHGRGIDREIEGRRGFRENAAPRQCDGKNQRKWQTAGIAKREHEEITPDWKPKGLKRIRSS